MNSANQPMRFRDEVKIGDLVLTYDSSSRIYRIETIASAY
jgi:predicted Mrr-cat superfamily restriction endonuclease